jgi:hypothetical protein
MAVSFIGGGNWSNRRKPPTCRKSLILKWEKICQPHAIFGTGLVKL